MTPKDVPGLGAVLDVGSNDHVYDAFMLCGALLVGLVVLVGRTIVTEPLVTLYITSFVGYVSYGIVRAG